MSWISNLFNPDTSAQTAADAQAQYLQLQAAQQEQATQAAQQQAAIDAANAANAPTDYDKALQAQQLSDLQTQQQRDTLRNNAMAQVSSTFQPEFEQSYLPSTFDQPYISSAFTQQRGAVDDYLNNLLKRGVITQQGYQGGEAAATEQEPGVRAQLQNVGDTLLAAQRSRLTDVANRAKDTASTLDVGQTFDPSVFSNELAQTNKDIGSQFGDLYSSEVPSGLFDLTGLASKAGAAQGAQNTAFDPTALAGGSATPTDDTTPPPATPKRSTSVF